MYGIPGLEQLRRLKPNWDSYGGKKISDDALKTARILIDVAPQTVPTSEGGIQLEWHCHGVDFEIVIRPDGTVKDDDASTTSTSQAQA